MSDQPSYIAPGSERTPGTRQSGEHGSWQGYATGYLVAMALTGAAFLFARSPLLTAASATSAVVVLAIAQMLVHLIFFLHINTSPEHKTNILAFILTIVIIAIVVVGSLWIMAHLNHNMMPMQRLIESQR
ncbi:cytochrome o ubiquinol oxidase subunit IV [Dyella sp. RRB7]|uniref:cytochrome o ubiquinol oxidase subunit IV n=1 Tax=Dyella sp. RRB7 TaxID=2919502 RepID=UPI001FAA7E63|nr:cytochrome o ubiquinol oxidase subunit IV [Dyella sp. RRB7]